MRDVNYAVRSLRKNRGFTAIAIVTLALGISVSTAAFSVLDTVLVRPLPFRDARQLVLIQDVNDKGVPGPASFPNFVDWRAQAKAFDGVASAMMPYTTSVVAGGEPLRVSTMGLSKGFFRIVGAPPSEGRDFTDEENSVGGPFAVMVSHGFWKNQLGGRFPLGEVEYNGRSVPIVGVAPPEFRLVGDPEVFFPHEQYPGTCRSCRNYFVVGRMRPGASLATAQASISSVARGLFAHYGPAQTMAVDARVTPLRESLTGSYRTALGAVFAAAGLVLLIACTNLVMALLARGLSREREVAVRTALGASRARIIRQLFIESSMLSFAGAILGTGMAFGLVRVIRALANGVLPRMSELGMDFRILAFAVGTTVIISVLVGLYPAIRLSGSHPGDAIRGASRDASVNAGGWLWKALIGFEMAIAVMLTIGSALMMRTMSNILANDVGFDPRGIVTALLSPDTLPVSQLERVRAELAGIPGVRGTAFISGMPLNWGNQSGPILRPTDVPPRFPGMAGFRVVSPEYFEVMQQPVLRGRGFMAGDVAGSTPVAVVTQGIASLLWPGENPIGKRVRTNYLIDQWLTVVGVVAEASSWSQPRGNQHEIFVSLRQFPERARNQLVAVVRTSGDPHAMIPVVRARLRNLLPATPALFDTVEDRIARTAADRKLVMCALVVFAAIALVLAAVGIYGVMSYAVTARTHEIGVRMALGATPANILRLILRTAAVMACIGIVAGAAGGWMATRYISSILYGVTPADPVAYLSGIGFLLSAALVGALVPAVRSSRVDPLMAIRGD